MVCCGSLILHLPVRALYSSSVGSGGGLLHAGVPVILYRARIYRCAAVVLEHGVAVWMCEVGPSFPCCMELCCKLSCRELRIACVQGSACLHSSACAHHWVERHSHALQGWCGEQGQWHWFQLYLALVMPALQVLCSSFVGQVLRAGASTLLVTVRLHGSGVPV
jgi:hypothetical protein